MSSETLVLTSSTCPLLARGPMRTSSFEGSPSLIFDSLPVSASITSCAYFSGTIVRLMAVHFCPALDVISLATSLMNRSNSSVPGRASLPSMEQLSESASMLKRTEFSTTEGCCLSIFPVSAEPVNVTTSCRVR